MDHHHGSQPRHRPIAPRGVPRGPACPGGAASRRRRHRRGGRCGRRSSAPDLHVLSSRARARRAGGPDAAAPRRTHDTGNRARLPGTRDDHGPAAGQSQEQDPRRGDSVPRAARGRPSGAPGARAGRRVSHLQRGIHRERGRAAGPRGSMRGGDPSWPAPCESDAQRAGSPGPAGADAARRVAPGRAGSVRAAISSCWPIRIAAGGIGR